MADPFLLHGNRMGIMFKQMWVKDGQLKAEWFVYDCVQHPVGTRIVGSKPGS